MVAFLGFPLYILPNFAEIIIRKLNKEEIENYRKKAKFYSAMDTDIQKLKEWLVVDLENWFLVRWA